jgi:hypothetical protein
MVLVVELRYRNNQQTVVLTRIAVHKRGTAIGTRTVSAEEFTTETLLKVSHHGFF